MRSGTRVRPAESGDVTALVALGEQSSPTPSGRDSEHAAAARRARYLRLLASPDRIVLVASDDSDDVIGMVVATDDELAATSPVRALVVGTLVVDLRHRRRGVGRALLAALVRAADERGIEQMVVSAASQDRDANRYLARLGFHPLVIRRIAPTGVLRRTLGMGELADRAVRRRRPVRAVLPVRATRGA